MDATSIDVTQTFHDKASVALRPTVTDAIAEAVLDEMAACGYTKLTMDGVAKRAGCSKPSLYRRWPSKQDMVIGVLQTIVIPPVPAALPAGDLQADVRDIVLSTYTWMNHAVVRQILPDLIAESLRNPSFAELLETRVSAPRRAVARTALLTSMGDATITERELEFILDIFAAPFFWKMFARRQEVDDEFIDTVAELVCTRITAVAQQRTQSRRGR